MSYFYLSFFNNSLLKGQRFVGATIVEADSDRVAFERAKMLRLVPPKCQTAVIHLWTQFEPSEEITRLEQIPAEARHLFNKFVSAENIKSQPHRPIGEGGEQFSVVCERHA